MPMNCLRRHFQETMVTEATQKMNAILKSQTRNKLSSQLEVSHLLPLLQVGWLLHPLRNVPGTLVCRVQGLKQLDFISQRCQIMPQTSDM